MHDSAETARWTLCGETKGPSPLRTQGSDVLYTHGGNVIAAFQEIGLPFVLSPNGVGIPSGISRKVVLAKPIINSEGHALYDFPAESLKDGPYKGLVMGVAFRIKNPQEFEVGSATQNRLNIRTRVNGKRSISRDLTVRSFAGVGEDGWQILLVSGFKNTKDAFQLEVFTKAVDPEQEESPLEAGEAFIMSTLRPDAAHYWLGPMDTEGNGQILAGDNGNYIAKSNSALGAPDWKWTDSKNRFATIRDLASANDATVFGTRWGHVYLADAENSVRQLNDIGVAHGGDVGEEVARVAIDKHANFAASGDRTGKITLYDVTQIQEGPIADVQSHKQAITALALRPDGGLLVSAAEDSLLRFWQVKKSGLELLLELQLDNPVVDLQFSPANTNLFMLCRGERGLRVLDLGVLKHKLAAFGIGWSEE